MSALSKTLLDAAERLSERSPSACLASPLLVLLDEAGNICRIPDLPDRYSHYRSRGIVVVTILQSEDQGKQVWPHGGFEKLLAASMWWVFAGGNASAAFYRNLSELIGDYEFTEKSTNSGRGGGSVQVAKRSERTSATWTRCPWAAWSSLPPAAAPPSCGRSRGSRTSDSESSSRCARTGCTVSRR